MHKCVPQKTSVNSELSNTRNMNFDNQASPILRTCRLNITLLKKNF